MIQINDIKWYTFKANTADPDGVKGPKVFAGPMFMGTKSYVLPKNPTEADKIIAVTTAVESGHYDAINMYDRAVVSVGLIQFIESDQFSVSDLLGCVAEKCGKEYVLNVLKPALDISKATFAKNLKGQWRFQFLDGRGEVNSKSKVRQLYLGCNGLKTSWTDDNIIRAKCWAVCIANVWNNEDARNVQLDFTRKRLNQFVGLNAKSVLFDNKPNEGWVGALRAAYYSFAINSPLFADLQIKKANANLKSEKWSKDWCIGVLKQLTFGTGIAFWPTRYNAIRPVLEKLWNVDLPNSSKDLSIWVEPSSEQTVITEEEISVSEPIIIPEIVINASDDDDEDEITKPVGIIIPKENVNNNQATSSVTEQAIEQVLKPVITHANTSSMLISFLKWLLQMIITHFVKKAK